MTLAISVYLFILGAIFGSFALAMVDRMRAKKDWVRGRSRCDRCKKVLKPIDLIPVFSWLSTGGKCRYCKTKLAVSYPLVEVGLGLSFVSSYIFWPTDLASSVEIASFVIWLAALVILCALFVYDLRWFILPNKLVYPLVFLSVVWASIEFMDQGFSLELVIDYLLSVFVASGLFLVLFVISKGKWIGDGDIRLGIAIGLFVGAPLNAWLVLFLASVIGLILSFPTMVKTDKKKRMKLKIPFGPMLILGLYVVVLFGDRLVDWYVSDILLL